MDTPLFEEFKNVTVRARKTGACRAAQPARLAPMAPEPALGTVGTRHSAVSRHGHGKNHTHSKLCLRSHIDSDLSCKTNVLITSNYQLLHC